MKLNLKKIKKFKLAKRRALVLFMLLLLVIFASLKVKSLFKNPEDLYELETVSKKNLTETVSISGKVDAVEKATLKFQTSGKLSWVGVQEGDRVKKWQAIASLDKRQLAFDLKKKLKDFETEFTKFEDTNENYKDDVLTDEIRRILKRSQNQLDKTVLDVEIANVSNQLATLVSPIEGIVIQTNEAVAGINTTPASTSFVIANPEKMKIRAEIDEVDIAKIKLGQKVLVTLDAYPEEEIEAKIDYISFSSTIGTAGNSVFPIEIILPENKDQKFKIGMSADIEIVVNEKHDILTIPFSALHFKEDKYIVKVLKEGKIIEKEVETGIESNERIEITSGIEEGEIIIVSQK